MKAAQLLSLFSLALTTFASSAEPRKPAVVPQISKVFKLLDKDRQLTFLAEHIMVNNGQSDLNDPVAYEEAFKKAGQPVPENCLKVK